MAQGIVTPARRVCYLNVASYLILQKEGEVDHISWTGLRVSQARVRMYPGNYTSSPSGEFPPSFNSFPGALMFSWNTSAMVQESTEPLGTNSTVDSGMAKPQSFKPGDGWFPCNLVDQPLYGSSP